MCVACGRAAGRYERACVYCGERVWRPSGYRAAHAAWIAAPPALLLWLTAAVRPDWRAACRTVLGGGAFAGYLFAAGAGLLLLPLEDDDLVTASDAERFRWQALSHAGALLCGGYAALGAACLACGARVGPAAWAAGLAVFACIAIAPLFFRIPWRAVAAATLWAAAWLSTPYL
jgi:hypothetical protein